MPINHFVKTIDISVTCVICLFSKFSLPSLWYNFRRKLNCCLTTVLLSLAFTHHNVNHHPSPILSPEQWESGIVYDTCLLVFEFTQRWLCPKNYLVVVLFEERKLVRRGQSFTLFLPACVQGVYMFVCLSPGQQTRRNQSMFDGDPNTNKSNLRSRGRTCMDSRAINFNSSRGHIGL